MNFMLKEARATELRFEIKRQLVHMSGGALISVLAFVLKPVYGWLVVLPVIAGIAVFLLIPKTIPELKMSNHVLFHFERKEDLKCFPYRGAVYFGLGILFPLALLPTAPACAAIIVLSVGDAFSTVFGKWFGRKKKGKTIEGFAAFVLSSFLAALFYVDVKTAVLFSVAGALAEIQPHVNDNISIPLILSVLHKIIY